MNKAFANLPRKRELVSFRDRWVEKIGTATVSHEMVSTESRLVGEGEISQKRGLCTFEYRDSQIDLLVREIRIQGPPPSLDQMRYACFVFANAAADVVNRVRFSAQTGCFGKEKRVGRSR
jgi:hypothetical protein